MELRINLEYVGSLICPLPAKRSDMSPGTLSFRLGTFELNLSVLNLDVYIELLTELVDVATAFTNQVVCELGAEIELESETALLLILLFLSNKSLGFLVKSIDAGGGTAESNSGASNTHSNRDVASSTNSGVLLFLDVSPELIMEPTYRG